MEAKNIVKISNVDRKFYLGIKTDPIYFRISGYVIGFLMHLVNAAVMMLGFRGEAMMDHHVKTYYQFQYRFITCWTFAMQMVYSAMGFYCDYTTLKSKREKEEKNMKIWKTFREMFFASIVVPYTFMVPSVFWTLYLYDRNLILPLSMNKVISSTSNHICHTAVIPFTLWEIVFFPRVPPKSSWSHMSLLVLFTSVYLCVLYYTYYEMGIWPYPILNVLQGTIYFQIFVGVVIGLLPLYYYLQWHLTEHVWSKNRLYIVKFE